MRAARLIGGPSGLYAIQCLGGLGMTDDTPLAFWFSHERAARIYDGADEVHKSSVARRILRGYGVDAG